MMKFSERQTELVKEFSTVGNDVYDETDSKKPKWMRTTLVAAGIYNLTWGAAIVTFPAALFLWAGMELPRYPQIWQCVGMIVGVYGVGYLIAAQDPCRHWPIVLVGLLGKIFGPIGFLAAALTGDLPWAWGVTIITNDLIWWIPFSGILYQTFRVHSNTFANRPFERGQSHWPKIRQETTFS